MKRAFSMPSSDTFTMKPAMDFLGAHLAGRSVDPFARRSRVATVTNDINPDCGCDYSMDAVKFLELMLDRGEQFDTGIFDPPYSPRQISECYRGIGVPVDSTSTQNAKLYKDCLDLMRQMCGRIIKFGWNSNGVGQGFDLADSLLIHHGGAHNDTICTAWYAVSLPSPNRGVP